LKSERLLKKYKEDNKDKENERRKGGNNKGQHAEKIEECYQSI